MVSGSDTVIEAFTELAPTYEDTIDRELREFWGMSYAQFVEDFVGVASIGAEDTVLDIATGTARIPAKVAEVLGSQGHAIGIDITPEMLRFARQNVAAAGGASGTDLVCGSGMQLPFVGGTFDVVLCGLGTHHMSVPTMLAEMRRVLKRGGELVLADVGASRNWRSSLGRILLRILVLRYRLTEGKARAEAESDAVANVRTSGEWKALLADSGFGSIEIDEVKARRAWYPGALVMTASAE